MFKWIGVFLKQLLKIWIHCSEPLMTLQNTIRFYPTIVFKNCFYILNTKNQLPQLTHSVSAASFLCSLKKKGWLLSKKGIVNIFSCCIEKKKKKSKCEQFILCLSVHGWFDMGSFWFTNCIVQIHTLWSGV